MHAGFRHRSGAGILFWRRFDGGPIEVLLGKRSLTLPHAPGTWSYPGGGLHRGERPLEGALREAAEETAGRRHPSLFRASPFRLNPDPLMVRREPADPGYAYTTFECKVGGEVHGWPHANWEHRGFSWFRFDRLPDKLHTEAARAIGLLLERYRGDAGTPPIPD